MTLHKQRNFAAICTLVAALSMTACGGSDSKTTTGSATAAANTAGGPGPGGGPFADLSDEDIKCLEGQGVTLPEMPEGAPAGAPDGQPPQGDPPSGDQPGDGQGQPPQGAPQGDPPAGMEDMQKAMSECGIDLPEPPDGAPQPGGQNDSGSTSAQATESKQS